jgi:hypothetical protein
LLIFWLITSALKKRSRRRTEAAVLGLAQNKRKKGAYLTPLKHSSKCLSLGGLVMRLTTTVTRKAKGRAITIGSTTGQGICVINKSLPRINFVIPSGVASDLCTKTIQKTLVNVPTTRPAIAP